MVLPIPEHPVPGFQVRHPIMAAMDLLGRRWVLRILWELRQGPMGFRALQAICDQMPPSTLSQRLSLLQSTGLISQTKKHTYGLTRTGQELLKALAPLQAWAELWADQLRKQEETGSASTDLERMKGPPHMTSSHPVHPTLDSIAPRSLVRDMERTLTFYGQLGFVTTYHDKGFAIVERDGVALHFNASDSEDPPQDHVLGWIGVTHIEALYQQYGPTGALQSPLQVGPEGRKEFVLRDPDRHLLIFQERSAVISSHPGQPTLLSITPHVPVADMEQALAFYAQLGFAPTTRSEESALVERDGVSLHFYVAAGHAVCWIGVTHIEALYQQYLPTGAIQSPRVTSQPWGMKTFFLCDPFRTLLLFGESIPIDASSTEREA
jgi:DNA-binding HxlR family transcriptional regulator/catechol 2,3-dioxygenase-like lactoylglutathione lyase family enzyme